MDRRGDGRASFEEPGGDLIGRWVPCRPPARESGILLYIYVHGIDDIVQRIVKQGGEVVKPPYPEADVWVATFRDPAGNQMGVWQFGPRESSG